MTVPKAARVRRTALPVYEVHVRDLDPADATRYEGIPVVTPLRGALDGIERHPGRSTDQPGDRFRAPPRSRDRR